MIFPLKLLDFLNLIKEKGLEPFFNYSLGCKRIGILNQHAINTNSKLLLKGLVAQRELTEWTLYVFLVDPFFDRAAEGDDNVILCLCLSP